MSDATQAAHWPNRVLARATRWAKGAVAGLVAALRDPGGGDSETDARDVEARVFQPPRNIAGSGPAKP